MASFDPLQVVHSTDDNTSKGTVSYSLRQIVKMDWMCCQVSHSATVFIQTDNIAYSHHLSPTTWWTRWALWPCQMYRVRHTHTHTLFFAVQRNYLSVLPGWLMALKWRARKVFFFLFKSDCQCAKTAMLNEQIPTKLMRWCDPERKISISVIYTLRLWPEAATFSQKVPGVCCWSSRLQWAGLCSLQVVLGLDSVMALRPWSVIRQALCGQPAPDTTTLTDIPPCLPASLGSLTAYTQAEHPTLIVLVDGPGHQSNWENGENSKYFCHRIPTLHPLPPKNVLPTLVWHCQKA